MAIDLYGEDKPGDVQKFLDAPGDDRLYTFQWPRFSISPVPPPPGGLAVPLPPLPPLFNPFREIKVIAAGNFEETRVINTDTLDEDRGVVYPNRYLGRTLEDEIYAAITLSLSERTATVTIPSRNVPHP